MDKENEFLKKFIQDIDLITFGPEPNLINISDGLKMIAFIKEAKASGWNEAENSYLKDEDDFRKINDSRLQVSPDIFKLIHKIKYDL